MVAHQLVVVPVVVSVLVVAPGFVPVPEPEPEPASATVILPYEAVGEQQRQLGQRLAGRMERQSFAAVAVVA